MCYQPTDPDEAMKVYNHAVEGLEMKFKGFGDAECTLKIFGADILYELKECGLDGMFMLNDAQNNIYSVITHHALFTLTEIRTQIMTFY